MIPFVLKKHLQQIKKMKNKHVLTKASKYTFFIGNLKNKLLFIKKANNTKMKIFAILINIKYVRK